MSQVTITMLRNPAKSFGCPLFEGDTGPVDSALARQLVSLGLAVEAGPLKQVRGVPESPTIMAEERGPAPAESAATPEESAMPAADRQSKHKK